MELELKLILKEDLSIVLDLFKSAAKKIAKKNVDHWQYWLNPPKEKIQWVKDGLQKDEFFFIIMGDETIGMVRIQDQDHLYWGDNTDNAKYIHSLVVSEEFKGLQIGSRVIRKIENRARKENCTFLRLDCDSKNPKLCDYYLNQGFVQVGRKELPLSIYNLYQKEIISEPIY
jgi:ribosomal protein S18 acetylase RimI-like enzyme